MLGLSAGSDCELFFIQDMSLYSYYLFPIVEVHTELMRKACGKDSHFWIMLLNKSKVDSSVQE